MNNQYCVLVQKPGPNLVANGEIATELGRFLRLHYPYDKPMFLVGRIIDYDKEYYLVPIATESDRFAPTLVEACITKGNIDVTLGGDQYTLGIYRVPHGI